MNNKLFLHPLGRVCQLLLPLLLLTSLAFAQTAEVAPVMADDLRASGKIYVVVAVVAIIVAGLLAYLISLDRKVSRLEKEMKS
ncbi:CcmD family protein [Hymenobacter artigasi]|uniref:CcmD family protein n=1 Tax=Hymenobacter artigasi TaxID=2719616 RepID=A0ABX1HI60_9BACT|nr:CcmD family protein [Hymenobacter artigasi]NKI89943.1 CcmD family protein [Hymenobacter artigasi]